MKHYDSISSKIQDITAYAFPKYDGSNVSCLYRNRKGLIRFGSRNCLFDESDQMGKFAIPLMKMEEEAITEILKYHGIDEATLFWEFFGSESFAGWHNWEAKDFQIVLIDISVERRGFLNPKDFIDMFENYDRVAPCIYHGRCGPEIIEQIRLSTFPGATQEGVVCKANRAKPNCHPPIMWKIKSNAWYNALHTKYKDQPEMIEKLA